MSVRDICTELQHNYIIRRNIETIKFDEKKNACIIVPKDTLHLAFNLEEKKMQIFTTFYREDASEFKLVKPLRYVVEGVTDLLIDREPELAIYEGQVAVLLEDDKEIKLAILRRKE